MKSEWRVTSNIIGGEYVKNRGGGRVCGHRIEPDERGMQKWD